ncbi:unnamed protein product [Urochloa humidicola]
MAGGYCTQELEQAAILLLPREIIVDTTTTSSAADHAVIEGLATHLASILGLAVAGRRTQHRPRPANPMTPHDRHISGVQMTAGIGAHVAPGSAKNDGMVLCPGTVKMFATPIAAPTASGHLLPEMERRQDARGTGVFLPARGHDGSVGTGVFMPLAGAYRTRPFKAPSSKGLKPPRLMRKEAQWQ